jgi:transcriptional regulator NrdR family protein
VSKPLGLHCIACGKGKLMTVDSRPCHGGIRRRKECNKCGYRVTTIETVVGRIRRRRSGEVA